MFGKKKIVLFLLIALALLGTAAVVSANSSPWCFDCECIWYDPDFCICTVDTSPGQNGFQSCWVQTVLGEDDCIVYGWCKISGI